MAWLLSTQLLFNSANYRLRSIQGIRANRVAIRLTTVFDSATTICANPFIVYIKVNVPPPGVLAYVFGTGIFY
jgi:hypothetical protein